MPRAENRENFFCSAPAGAMATRFLTSCRRRARVGAPPEDDKPEEWGIAVVAEGIKVGDGARIPAKSMVTRNVKSGGVR